MRASFYLTSLLWASLLAFAGSSQSQTFVTKSIGDAGPGRYTLEIGKDEWFYDGKLREDGVAKLIKSYQAAQEKPSVLAIRSSGGSTLAGLVLGNFVFDSGLSVRVIDYCGSSCANYVFPAGKRKSLNKGAILWWHGSMHSKSWEIPGAAERHECESVDACGAELAAIADQQYACRNPANCAQEKAEAVKFFSANFDNLRRFEREFFAKVGVDPAFAVYGNEVVICNCVWTFDIETLQRFGIDNVFVEKGPPHPLDDEAKKTLQEAKVQVVRLKVK